MPDYDPLTISDEELKALPAAERGAVYKARAAAKAGGAPAAPGAAAARPAAPASDAPAPQDTSGAAATAGATGTSSPTSPESPAAPAVSPAASASTVPTAPAAVDGGSAPSTTPSPAPAGGAAVPAGAAAPKEPDKPKEPPFVTAILAEVGDATWQWRHGYAEIKVPRDALLTAATSLRAQGFDYLSFITEVDWQDRYELVYHVYSYDYAAQPLGAILRCELPRDGMPSVASLTAVWPGAEFMEREAFEMLGIRFLGHPDLRRILLPDDFVGFPMRRDYETDYAYVTVKNLVHESD